MKNKEIEEMIQNRIEDIYQSGEYIYQAKELEEILSYIEQLEKDKKELKDGWQQEIYDKNKVLNDWLEAQRKINVLENNRDKAIEYINEMSGYDVEDYIRQDLLLLLKGDSDDK